MHRNLTLMVVSRPQTSPGGSGVSPTDFLLANEPDAVGASYAITYTSGLVTKETWTNTATTNTIKTIDYTYTTGLVTQEVRKVFASDGTTITGQVTITYSYTGTNLTSETLVRNV